jgi:hypothetical protein
VDSIHRFKVEGIAGEEIDFAEVKGKKILVSPFDEVILIQIEE